MYIPGQRETFFFIAKSLKLYVCGGVLVEILIVEEEEEQMKF